jgi:hypothetical protein
VLEDTSRDKSKDYKKHYYNTGLKKSFHQDKGDFSHKNVVVENINRDFPWTYFVGVA